MHVLILIDQVQPKQLSQDRSLGKSQQYYQHRSRHAIVGKHQFAECFQRSFQTPLYSQTMAYMELCRKFSVYTIALCEQCIDFTEIQDCKHVSSRCCTWTHKMHGIIIVVIIVCAVTSDNKLQDRNTMSLQTHAITMMVLNDIMAIPRKSLPRIHHNLQVLNFLLLIS